MVKHNDFHNSPEASTEALRRPKCARVGGTPGPGGGEEGEGGEYAKYEQFARDSRRPATLLPKVRKVRRIACPSGYPPTLS